MFKMHLFNVCLKIMVFVFLSLPSFANEVDEHINKKTTDLLTPNWPFEAFLAIPRIAEMKPILAIEISKEEQILVSANCIEIYYLELKKKFEPNAILERESLHNLLCKAMKRAVQKTDKLLVIKNFINYDSVGLSFDFFNGLISLVEIPYPPTDPISSLENVFLDEGVILNFGDIDLPEDLNLEISQTPL